MFVVFISFWVSEVSELHLCLLWGGCVMLPGRILDLAQHRTSQSVWATAPWWDEPFHLLSAVLLWDVQTHFLTSPLSWFQSEAELGHPGAHPAHLLLCSHSRSKFQNPETLQAQKRPLSRGGPPQVTGASVNTADVPKRTSLICVCSCVSTQAWVCVRAARAGGFSSSNFHLNIVFLSQPVTLKARWNPATQEVQLSQQITVF